MLHISFNFQTSQKRRLGSQGQIWQVGKLCFNIDSSLKQAMFESASTTATFQEKFLKKSFKSAKLHNSLDL